MAIVNAPTVSTLPPAVADAFQLLRQDLYGHLDEAEYLATKTTGWSTHDVEVARALIPDLVLVIRGLLGEHGVDRAGLCQTCAAAWPCPVVSTVRDLLKDPDRQFVALFDRIHHVPPAESPYTVQ